MYNEKSNEIIFKGQTKYEEPEKKGNNRPTRINENQIRVY